ncbi:hypothetical protein LCGC14_1402510, partial [marine sediment metagenome]
ELINELDFYTRISIGQLQHLKYLRKTASEKTLTLLQKEMFPDLTGLNHSWGIHNIKVPESVKVCYDIYKQIHFIWNPVGVYADKPFSISKEGLPYFEEVHNINQRSNKNEN